MLDPLRTDWSTIAPIAGFGPIEWTAAGFRAATEAGPIVVSAFAPDIFRVTLGEPSGPDFGIFVAEPQPPAGIDVHATKYGGAPVRLGQPRTAVVLEQRQLALRAVGADPDLFDLLEQVCRERV